MATLVAQLVHRGLPRRGYGAWIFGDCLVRPAGHFCPVLLPQLSIAGETEPELCDVGAGLFERECELTEIDGELPSLFGIARRLLSALVGALQEEGDGICPAEHIKLE